MAAGRGGPGIQGLAVVKGAEDAAHILGPADAKGLGDFDAPVGVQVDEALAAQLHV